MIERHGGSFRDPLGQIFLREEQVFRKLSSAGWGQYHAVKDTGLFDKLEGEGKLIRTQVTQSPLAHSAPDEFTEWLQHERIRVISYPYEWPFTLLKQAALLHLEIHLDALKLGVTLRDASAYNIQYDGVRPMFIDVLSFAPYEEGGYWSAHWQFCQQFLCPLLLAAKTDIDFQLLFRSHLDGVPVETAVAALPLFTRFAPRPLLHLTLPARLDRSSRHQDNLPALAHRRPLPKARLIAMLEQLKHWISSLDSKRRGTTLWQDYEATCLYSDSETDAKSKIVAEFAGRVKPPMLLDVGCNSGAYSEIALNSGANYCVGLDVDLGALSAAVTRAKNKVLALLPLVQDLANPSPAQGWLLSEREPLSLRLNADGLLALAVVHHLALGRNIPLPEVVTHLVSLAPAGIIEFVPKADPNAQRLLVLKGDIFPDYDEAVFEATLAGHARILHKHRVTAAGRTMYEYART